MVRQMSKKVCFWRHLDRQQGKWVETPLAIWMAASLKYLLITVKVVPLEKVSFSDTQNPKSVDTLIVDQKHYLLTRNNLTQPIQIQLYQKQETFWKYFFAFLKSILNFQHLPTKDDTHSWCIYGNTGCEKYVR